MVFDPESGRNRVGDARKVVDEISLPAEIPIDKDEPVVLLLSLGYKVQVPWIEIGYSPIDLNLEAALPQERDRAGQEDDDQPGKAPLNRGKCVFHRILPFIFPGRGVPCSAASR
jgi:hypothetical protein